MLRAEKLGKAFEGRRVLSEVSFEAKAGEIHALAGVNGAGKSTLLALLSGALRPDSGTLSLDGAPVVLRSPQSAREHGIAMIHQELSLVGTMSVAENLALVRPGGALRAVSARADRELARTTLKEHGLELDPDALVETLPLATQQLLEIARALSIDARVVILDEPTSALGEGDAARLLARLGELREAGKAIVLVSHRLDEVLAHASRISVLAGGEIALSEPTNSLDRERIVRAMIGTDLAAPGLAPAAEERVRLSVSDLVVPRRAGSGRAVDGLSLEVHAGEIVGLAGFRGSGASEVLRGLFGAEPGATGRVLVDGEPFALGEPARAIARGVLFLPADRKAEGGAPELLVPEVATLSALGRFTRGPLLALGDEAREVERRLGDVALAKEVLGARLGSLSGGTQQKVGLLRCLLAQPRVLLADEPTRGVDVAAKAAIAGRLRALAAEGAAILLASAEIDELLDLATRFYVLSQGRVVDRMTRRDATRERLVHAATSG